MVFCVLQKWLALQPLIGSIQGINSLNDAIAGLVGFARQFHALLGDERLEQRIEWIEDAGLAADFEIAVLFYGADATSFTLPATTPEKARRRLAANWWRS